MKKIFLLFALFIFTNKIINAAGYCTPSFTNACSSNDFINNFSTTGGIGNITNLNSGCCGNANNYVQVNQTAMQVQGGTITLSMQSGSTWSQGFAVWIDWNQDLTFQPSEQVYASTTSSTSVFTTTITVPASATPGPTRMRVMCRYASLIPAADACQTTYSFGETEDYNFIVISPVQCGGYPTAGTISPSGTTYLCPSLTLNLSTNGSSATANLQYQWQSAPLSGTPWTSITGANSPNYQIPPATPSALYRMIITCGNTNKHDTTNADTVILQNPNYAAIPYTQSFETWVNYCDNFDVPIGMNWKNSPVTGNNSWRRDDLGGTGNWSTNTLGIYTPTSSHLNHSARFHSYYAGTTIGNFDLYLDLSSQIGTKTLYFDYNNKNGTDSLFINFSTDGGLTFTPLQGFDTTSIWKTYGVLLNSNSATCIVRFTAKGGGTTDIGIDNIKVFPPCAGTPFAGLINDSSVCAGAAFNLTTNGSSASGGLNFVWQSAPSATGPWTTLGNTISSSYPISINTITYFRAIVTCSNSGLSDTTNIAKFNINEIYYCYCGTTITTHTNTINVGNVYVSKGSPVNTLLFNNLPIAATDTLNNTSFMPAYTSYDNALPIPTIYLDSTYNIKITDITSGSVPVSTASTKVFIDYNRDGVFDPVTEIVASGNNNATGYKNTLKSTFLVPNNTVVNPTNNPAFSNINIINTGITGLRVISNSSTTPLNINPCGIMTDGETEDYLVKISLPPCVASSYGGLSLISDTAVCPGFNISLYNTTHSSTYTSIGISTQWQDSLAGSSTWVDVPAGTADTIVFNVSMPTYFRFRVICSATDTVYSNIVHVNMKPSFACYNPSEAVGGILDTTDIGAFTIGAYSYLQPGGSHLHNAAAKKAYTDYTNTGVITLYNDSTYQASIYDIMRSNTHGDAKVTMFIDYNNDKNYTASERVFSGTSSTSTYYLPFSFHTSLNPVMNVVTGMRLIINNNTAPNAASDNGSGTYTSGETEDYVVKFIQKPLAITDILNFENVNVYPNPSTGVVNIDVNVSEVKNVQLSVTNIIGAEVYTKDLGNINGNYSTTLNLGKLAKGTYLVKLQGDKGSVVRRIVLQ